jgi:hypothetical protein
MAMKWQATRTPSSLIGGEAAVSLLWLRTRSLFAGARAAQRRRGDDLDQVG